MSFLERERCAETLDRYATCSVVECDGQARGIRLPFERRPARTLMVAIGLLQVEIWYFSGEKHIFNVPYDGEKFEESDYSTRGDELVPSMLACDWLPCFISECSQFATLASPERSALRSDRFDVLSSLSFHAERDSVVTHGV